MIEITTLIKKLRTRIDDLDTADFEYTDVELTDHLQNSLDKYNMLLPLEKASDGQLIIVETMIAIVTALKMWADGESYSYKNDAVQMTRGLMSKHYLDTLKQLRIERNDILEGNGGVY
jgi:hypothetical protein